MNQTVSEITEHLAKLHQEIKALTYCLREEKRVFFRMESTQRIQEFRSVKRVQAQALLRELDTALKKRE